MTHAIFVLGLQRSGTTLAANLLAAHPDIAAVTAERHHGVHESVFFSHFARIHGDWSDTEAQERILRDFLRSDYFRLTGLGEDLVRDCARQSASSGAFFGAVMDALARSRGARAWVEKSPHHTLLADTIAAQLPRAVFLCVTRDTEGLLRSRLWSYGRHPPPYPRRALPVARAAASNVFHRRHMAALPDRIGPDRIFHVTFRDLRDDPDRALAPLLNRLGLARPDGLRPEFAPNSSFASDSERERALSSTDRNLARLVETAAEALPQGMLAALQRRLAARRPTRYPAWVWPPDETAPEENHVP